MSASGEATDRLLFEQLVKDTREDLLAYAMRRAANREDAADVLSETYLIAWRKLEKIPPGESARLWLFGVAANVLRRGAKRHRSSEALIYRLASEPQATVEIESAGPEDQTARALRAGLASLAARDREILTLTAWEGLTPKQIASVMGLPTNLIRVRLHRARSRLKRRLTHTGTSASDTDASLLTAKPRVMQND
jgi:RNA polymerase sigma-70 factor (ECF subfamily)